MITISLRLVDLRKPLWNSTTSLMMTLVRGIRSLQMKPIMRMMKMMRMVTLMPTNWWILTHIRISEMQAWVVDLVEIRSLPSLLLLPSVLRWLLLPVKQHLVPHHSRISWLHPRKEVYWDLPRLSELIWPSSVVMMKMSLSLLKKLKSSLPSILINSTIKKLT